MNHEQAESMIVHEAPAWPARWRWLDGSPGYHDVDVISESVVHFGSARGCRGYRTFDIEWTERALRFRWVNPKDSTAGPNYRVVIVPVVGLDGSDPDCVVIDDHDGIVRYGLVVLTRETT